MQSSVQTTWLICLGDDGRSGTCSLSSRVVGTWNKTAEPGWCRACGCGSTQMVRRYDNWTDCSPTHVLSVFRSQVFIANAQNFLTFLFPIATVLILLRDMRLVRLV